MGARTISHEVAGERWRRNREVPSRAALAGSWSADLWGLRRRGDDRAVGYFTGKEVAGTDHVLSTDLDGDRG